MLAISIICAIVVLVIVLCTNIGNEFRPPPEATGPAGRGRAARRLGPARWLS